MFTISELTLFPWVGISKPITLLPSSRIVLIGIDHWSSMSWSILVHSLERRISVWSGHRCSTLLITSVLFWRQTKNTEGGAFYFRPLGSHVNISWCCARLLTVTFCSLDAWVGNIKWIFQLHLELESFVLTENASTRCVSIGISFKIIAVEVIDELKINIIEHVDRVSWWHCWTGAL